MKISTILLIPVLVLGLVGVTEANRIKPASITNAGSQVAESLRSAHKLLAEADHDYHGNRMAAMHKVHMALKEMGLEPSVRGTKGAARSGKSGEHEPQAASDAKLRQAQQILQGVSGTVTSGHVAAHVKAAIAEINTALSVR